jgi:hypothetical protein
MSQTGVVQLSVAPLKNFVGRFSRTIEFCLTNSHNRQRRLFQQQASGMPGHQDGAVLS